MKTNCSIHANFTTPSFIDPELLPIEVLHCENREFHVFLRKIVKIIIFLIALQKWRICHRNTFSDTLPTILACMLPELKAFKVLFYAESVGVVTSGHVTDGGHTIRSAISENQLLYANFTTLSFIEPELWPIEVLHGGNREFCIFLRKIVEIIKKFCSHPKKDVAVTETHLLSHKTRKSVKRCDLYRCARNKKVTGCKKNRHGRWQFHAYAEPPP